MSCLWESEQCKLFGVVGSKYIVQQLIACDDAFIQLDNKVINKRHADSCMKISLSIISCCVETVRLPLYNAGHNNINASDGTQMRCSYGGRPHWTRLTRSVVDSFSYYASYIGENNDICMCWSVACELYHHQGWASEWPDVKNCKWLAGLTRSGTGCFITVTIWQHWASKG